MPELTDDQLDGLFRKSAEEFDPPFDPAAWRDMKTRLDANDRTVTGGLIWKKLLRWGLPVLLLLLTGGAWYAYRNVSPVVNKANSRVISEAGPALSGYTKQRQMPAEIPEVISKTGKSVRTPTVGSNESDVNAGRQPADLVASVAEPVKTENRFDKSVAKSAIRSRKNSVSTPIAATKRPVSTYGSLKTKRSRPIETISNKSIVTIGRNVAGTASYRLGKANLNVSKSGRRQRNATISRYGTSLATTSYAVISNRLVSKRRASNRQRSVSDNPVEPSGIVNPIAESGTGITSPVTLSELAIRPAKWPKSLAFSNRDVTIHPDTTARSVVPKAPSDRGLSVRFVVSPDLSTIGLKNFSRPGTNIGLLLEYRITSRWSVQAGVIQSTKVYKASGDDYGYLPDYLDRYRSNLIGIDGRCSMLDIPINLRYDIALRPQSDSQLLSRWFISGGVTSYIMKQEDYNYKFVRVYSTTPSETSESTGGYGFSNLNLSVGYERALSRKLSLQIEPFIKAPIRAVGYFKVNLLSTGAFFSIRYKLSK